MPLVSYEESCRISGISPEECEVQGKAEAARIVRAKTLCDTAFQHDLETRNSCVLSCSTSTTELDACVAYVAAHQDVESIHQAQQFHTYGAAAGLLLLVGAYLLGRRRRP